MTELRDIDYNGFVPSSPGPRHRKRPGWRGIPVWLRWCIAADAAVFFGALIVALVHP